MTMTSFFFFFTSVVDVRVPPTQKTPEGLRNLNVAFKLQRFFLLQKLEITVGNISL